MRLQSIIRAIYPYACVSCDAPVETPQGLCSACWRDAAFITGTVCDACGAPLTGEADETPIQCDDCLTAARPWSRGRSTLVYGGVGRKLVLALKHGDRTDLVPTLGDWMARAGRDLLTPDTILVPVPLHWSRLLRRRFNQAAMLAQVIARIAGCSVQLDAVRRRRRTAPLDGHSREARFAALAGTMAVDPDAGAALVGRQVVLVDDVMTSGATLAAVTDALMAAGVADVSILTLARVVKDP